MYLYLINLILKKKEVIDPAMTVKITGLLYKLYYLFYKNVIFSIYGLKFYILFIYKYMYLYKTLFINITLKNKNFHTLVKAKNRIGPHENDVISIIVGSLLLKHKYFCSLLNIENYNLYFNIKHFYNKNYFNTLNFVSSNIKGNKKPCLNPYWISGFADAESSFIISIFKSNERKLGWRVMPIFVIELDGKDIELLNRIKSYFGVGNIIISKRDGHVIYSVKSIKDNYSSIIPHFNKYSLLTQKQLDFKFFKLAVELINNKEHLTLYGLKKIVEIRASINRGLSKTLLENFPDIKLFPKPQINSVEIKDPNWLVGFIDGEGCFYVNIFKSKTKIGYAVQLNFKITQHIRDKELFFIINKYYSCGNTLVNFTDSRVDFIIRKLGDIINILVPFFNNYPLQSYKKLEYEKFVQIVDLMKNKNHLTNFGLEKIKEIKYTMNKGRNKQD